MELEEIVSRFVMAMKPIDDSIEHGRKTKSKWGEYLPGIGTAYEIDIRNELMIWWNKQFNDSKMQKEQPYPEKDVKGNCDVCIFENTDGIRSSEIFDWAIELKSVANIGDNGGINNYGLGKVVSPYKSGRSSVHDCGKLSGSKIAKRKAIIIFGFEFDDNSVTISIVIDDSPKLSRLQKTITYDPAILSYSQYEILDFFDSDYYDFFPQSYDSDGYLILEFKHKNAYQSSSADETSFSVGGGSILNLTFLVNPNDSISTASFIIPETSVSADSYNFSIGESYPLDMNFWTIEESLQINF